MNEKISFVFPAKKEYISAIRLAASGVANSFDFNVGKIEDIKACVAEACLLLMCEQTCESLQIDMECDGALRARVCGTGAQRISPGEDCMEFNAEMSQILIKALSQDASFAQEGNVFNEVLFTIKPDSEE